MDLLNWLQQKNRINLFFYSSLIVAILLHLFFVFFKELNLDQATSIGFILHPWWGSIFWDNSPPTVYFIGKLIYGIVSPNIEALITILKGLVAETGILSALSVFFLIDQHSIFNSFKFSRLIKVIGFVAIAIFPVPYVDATGLRPVFLVEFFATLNFVSVVLQMDSTQSSNMNSSSTIKWPSWILKTLKAKWFFWLTAIGLLSTSYLSIVYFTCLSMFYFFRKTFLSVDLDQNQREFFSRSRILFLGLIIISVGLLFLIRDDHLVWLGQNLTLWQSLQGSLLWASRLSGYSWFALGVIALSFIIARKFIFFLPFGFLLLINVVSGRAADEPRFVIFLWPILLLGWLFSLREILIAQVTQEASNQSPFKNSNNEPELDRGEHRKFKFLKAYQKSFVIFSVSGLFLAWIWQVAWFAHEPRSQLIHAVSEVLSDKPTALIPSVSRAALDYLFPNVPVIDWNSFNPECNMSYALLSPTHQPQAKLDVHLQNALQSGLQIVSEKIFDSRLEEIRIIFFNKDCVLE